MLVYNDALVSADPSGKMFPGIFLEKDVLRDL